jgi:hypothetical protein
VENQKPGLWRFVPQDHYPRPVDPARDAVREGILGLLDRLRKSEITSEAFLMRTDLASVPSYLMERVAAHPDWTVQTPALNQALGARPSPSAHTGRGIGWGSTVCTVR